MSFDNAANNNSAARNLQISLNPLLGGELFHVGCVCHIIHLCVKDGLKEIVGPVEKIRSCLAHIVSSTSRVQRYTELIVNNSKKFRYPYLDTKIRWNSTFRMLQECREFAHEIVEICASFKCANPNSDLDEFLTMKDFEIIDVLGPFLQVFKKVSEMMSGQFYPTSNLMLVHMVEIFNFFYVNKDKGLLGDVIDGMLAKWLKYYAKVPTVALLTTALDPRCKIEGCLTLMQMYYKNLGLLKDFDERKEKDRIYSSFEKLYEYYNDAPTNELIATTQVQAKRKGVFLNLFGKNKKTTHTTSGEGSINEVSYYFGKNTVEDDDGIFDILNWWNTEARYFPILRRIARDLLASQMSTVASESCFSAAGRTLTDKRSRLTPKSIRFCVMWKDMLDAEDRTNELRRTKPEIEEEDHPLVRGFLAKDEDLIPEDWEEAEPEIGTSCSQSKFDWLSKYDFTSF